MVNPSSGVGHSDLEGIGSVKAGSTDRVKLGGSGWKRQGQLKPIRLASASIDFDKIQRLRFFFAIEFDGLPPDSAVAPERTPSELWELHVESAPIVVSHDPVKGAHLIALGKDDLPPGGHRADVPNSRLAPDRANESLEECAAVGQRGRQIRGSCEATDHQDHQERPRESVEHGAWVGQ